jgi:D-sedoheptulose 7-phosphate isomerase
MSYPQDYLEGVRGAIGTLDLARIGQAIAWFREARDAGRTIFVCGNGGSACTASHFATELLKGASYGRPRRFRIHALADSFSTMSAYANDLSHECLFAEQLKNLAAPGDLVMGLSGSGNSLNVLRAIEYANSIGCRTLTLTGHDGGKIGPAAQLNINVAAPHQGRIEDTQMIVCHMICYYFMDRVDEQEAAAL